MAAPATKPAKISPELQRVLDWHREEAARLREELGDPMEAMSAFVRKHFDPESLEESLREGGSFWADDEDHDEW